MLSLVLIRVIFKYQLGIELGRGEIYLPRPNSMPFWHSLSNNQNPGLLSENGKMLNIMGCTSTRYFLRNEQPIITSSDRSYGIEPNIVTEQRH